MNIADGLAIDNSRTVIPWGITPKRLAGLTGPDALTEVSRDFYVTDCSVLAGLEVTLGFRFRGGKLKEIELFRRLAIPLPESYAEFQRHLESVFGPPDSVTKGNCGFKDCEWRIRGVKVWHTVFERFGPEEHVRITR